MVFDVNQSLLTHRNRPIGRKIIWCEALTIKNNFKT